LHNLNTLTISCHFTIGFKNQPLARVTRIFVRWAIVYLRQFLEKHVSSQNFGATFLFKSTYVSLILTKKWAGLFFGLLCTKTSTGQLTVLRSKQVLGSGGTSRKRFLERQESVFSNAIFLCNKKGLTCSKTSI
jgi:hypothetical protein